MAVKLGKNNVGAGESVYIIGEIGINHNGDIEIAKKIIDKASEAGFSAVKFQKRTPELCVPDHQKSIQRNTPWGMMTYLQYKEKMEFGADEYTEISRYCKQKGIDWFASVWDKRSVDFMEDYKPICYKVASASITDIDLLTYIASKGRPIIISTGMSTMEQIEKAVSVLDDVQLLIAHSTSSYPCSYDELNLKMIKTLSEKYNVPIGYSGHEKGVQTSVAAVALGASHIERHITLDRTMWGTDQAASLEPKGMATLVRDIRVLERALGDGVKRVYDSELPIIAKLRL